ncbi:MAG: FAD:protein FMN transferase, partial [Christensenellales bacterium]
MKKTVAAVLALMLLFAFGCAPKKELKRYQAEFLTLFNTVTRVVGYAESEEAFRKIAQTVRNQL